MVKGKRDRPRGGGFCKCAEEVRIRGKKRYQYQIEKRESVSVRSITIRGLGFEKKTKSALGKGAVSEVGGSEKWKNPRKKRGKKDEIYLTGSGQRAFFSQMDSGKGGEGKRQNVFLRKKKLHRDVSPRKNRCGGGKVTRQY